MTSLLQPAPKLIWNASASVPIGLYAVHPVGVHHVGELVLVRPPEALASFLQERGYLAMGVPILKHVLALPGQSVCRTGRTITVDGDDRGRCARPRSSRTKPARLAGLPDRRGWRGLPDELAVRELVRRSLLRPAARFDHRRSRHSPLDRKATDRAWVLPPTIRPTARQCGSRPPPFRSCVGPSLPTDEPADRGSGDCACAARVRSFCSGRQCHARPAGRCTSCQCSCNGRSHREASWKRHRSDSQFRRPGFEPSCRRKVVAWCVLVSPKGAMGLMQIMPDTWAELRSRYGLGPDPYDPHDNIIAGTAYLRELLDRYGERGFLAAYNAGPSRYEEHLATGRPLPSETLSYMAAVTSLSGSASMSREVATVLRLLMDIKLALRIATAARLCDASTAGQWATGSVPRWQSERADSACAALRRPVCPEIRSDSTAMTSIGSVVLWRAVAHAEYQGRCGRETPPTDGKGKAPPPDGRIWLVGLSFRGL